MVSNLPSAAIATAVTLGCSRTRCWVAVVAPSVKNLHSLTCSSDASTWSTASLASRPALHPASSAILSPTATANGSVW